MANPEVLVAGIRASAAAVASLEKQVAALGAACDLVVGALRGSGKILTAGNGGSAAEAMHMTEELVGRFRSNRASLAGVSLCADPTALTCIANDFGYETIFSRQVEGLGRPGDVLVIFSTSGSSPNLVRAVEAAKARGLRTICMLGKGGGALAGKGDVELIVAEKATERIQEAHQVAMHLILDAVETAFTAGGTGKGRPGRAP